MCNSPIPGIQGNSSGVLHLPGQESGAHGAVQLGHLDLIQITFHPVNVSCYPVYCQTLGGGQAVLDDHIKSGQSYRKTLETVNVFYPTTSLSERSQHRRKERLSAEKKKKKSNIFLSPISVYTCPSNQNFKKNPVPKALHSPNELIHSLPTCRRKALKAADGNTSRLRPRR